MLDRIHEICQHAQEIFKRIKSAPQDLNRKFGRCSRYYKLLTDDAHRASELIKWSIQFMKGSELNLVQDAWGGQLDRLEDYIWEIICAIDPRTNLQIADEFQNQSRLVHASVIHLARTSLPMLKLSKIFYTKLSKRWMNQRHFLPYSDMSSDRIEVVANSIGFVSQDIDALIHLFFKADSDHSETTSQEFTRVTSDIKSHLESALLPIVAHYLPLIPDTECFSSKEYYKNWLITWNTQYNISINNWDHAVQMFHSTLH
ncbi:hypothetical protein PtA15_18A229 [Puccinia triticina]|nr:uncharacterized protein PtA15_18A229 [Puccinia triticina]WAQ93171.1 hypothetical protein PtA15_18A229 [Puccinia triticina]